MNKYFLLSSALGIFLSIPFLSACSQKPGKWEKDSVYNALTNIFPTGSKIVLIDSGKVQQTDSLLNGWWMKATIDVPGDTSQSFFFFYRYGDTSLFKRLLEAAVNSQMNAIFGKSPKPYMISIPFSDSNSPTMLLYSLRMDTTNLAENSKEFERKVCSIFRVPHYSSSITIEDVKLEEVRQEKDEPPPPPPPPKKNAPKKEVKGN